MQPGPMMGSQNAQQSGMQPGPMMNQYNAQQVGMQQPVSGHPMMHPALPGVMGAIHQAMPTSQPMHPTMVGALNDFLHAHQAMQPQPGMAMNLGNALGSSNNYLPNQLGGPMMAANRNVGVMPGLAARLTGPGYR